MPPALTAVSRSAVKAASAAEERDNAIRHAHAEGVTLRAIAEAAGISHQRVWQIVRQK